LHQDLPRPFKGGGLMEMFKNQLEDVKKDLQDQTKTEGNKKKSVKPTPEIIKSKIENKTGNTKSDSHAKIKEKKAVGKVGGRRKKK
jgi:Sec-independent protein translocase protein TatA